MKQIIAILWSFLIAWVFSALILSTDADVGGVSGLLSLPNMVSVTSIAALLLIPMFLCLLLFNHRGWRGFVVAVFLSALVLGAFLAMGGSTAKTIPGFVVSLGGAVGMLLVVLCLGTLPHIVISSKKLRSFQRADEARGSGSQLRRSNSE